MLIGYKYSAFYKFMYRLPTYIYYLSDIVLADLELYEMRQKK
jgi:hypothetical protein